ncbi:glycoside hydrolase family 128 protein [Diplodia corticola]|uniref:Glycoside hydrolase family 128 protein n=1 Tax=Diplodia corticola TaxID=236234 RepID=A0A1J9SBC7_9PEZI|nr:glycoside hydrolase family 128 protein [Diplodia corticola]OJD37156.1 glycoside hydrolase family 128 protein [Diplodia corticola]
MQYRFNELALLALAGSALAHQPHQHKHAKLHERRLAAPYGMGNDTLPAGPTGGVAPPPQDSTVTQLMTATVHATQLYTQSAPSAAANPIQAAEVDAESVDAASSSGAALTTDAETCDEVTVTVTNAPVTVTVTAAAGGVASSAASSYVAPSSVAAPSSFVLPGSSSTVEISTEAAAPAPTAASSSVYVAPSSAPAETVEAISSSSSSAVYVAPTTSVAASSAPASSAPATTVAPSSTVAATTSSTSSSAAATSSAATGVTGVTDKRGLVYNTFTGIVDQFTSSQISWGWNWAQTPGGTMPDGVEFVPILWGNRETDDLANWKSNAEEQISSGSTHLMGFNEPDVDSSGGGSNMAADVAASVYKEYMNDFASKASLVSPGVCNGEGLRESTGRNQGLDWLQDFYDACGGFTDSGCKVDKINIHWYSSYQGDLDSTISYFKEYVEKAYNKFSINLWITEYQLQNADDATQEEFITKTSEWMSSQTYIERYSYFKAESIVGSSSLMSAYTS